MSFIECLYIENNRQQLFDNLRSASSRLVSQDDENIDWNTFYVCFRRVIRKGLTFVGMKINESDFIDLSSVITNEIEILSSLPIEMDPIGLMKDRDRALSKAEREKKEKVQLRRKMGDLSEDEKEKFARYAYPNAGKINKYKSLASRDIPIDPEDPSKGTRTIIDRLFSASGDNKQRQEFKKREADFDKPETPPDPEPPVDKEKARERVRDEIGKPKTKVTRPKKD
jgi:hypothetical protein